MPSSGYGILIPSSPPEGYLYLSVGNINEVRTKVFWAVPEGYTYFDVEGKDSGLLRMEKSWKYGAKTFFLDGQIYLINRHDIEVFNIKTQVWSKVKVHSAWYAYLIVAFGDIFSFGTDGVMKFNSSENVWRW